jgi:hypothetical protein
MTQTSEISADHLVRALRIYVNDLTDKHSPFNKSEESLRDLAAWIACAATRIATLATVNQDAGTKGSEHL